MSLRVRMSLAWALMVALVVAVLGTALYFTMQKRLADEMDRRLSVRADEVQYAIWPGQNAPTLGDLTPDKLDLSPLDDIDSAGMYVQVLDTSGNILGVSSNLQGSSMPVDDAQFQSAFAQKPAFGNVTIGGNRTIRVLSVPVLVQKKVAAVLQVSQSRQPLKETLDGLKLLSGGVGSVAVLVAAVVGWLVSYRGLNPLTVISTEAADIAAKSDFQRRLRMDGRKDEIGVLARTIDGLLSKVDQTLQAHREFVADTSHELRNPLLSIRTGLGVIDRLDDPDERRECIRDMREQVVRMTRLVSDLLLLAQVERGLVLDRRPVDVLLVVEQAVQEARLRARGQVLRVEHSEPIEMLADAGRMSQILANLLDNAIKHTPSGSSITVRTGRSEDGVTLEVEDTGAGIAPEHLPHIFERAYRVTASQPGPEASYGLGLAIVKYLTEAHGGHVQVDSVLGRGTRFTVWLPERTPREREVFSSMLPFTQPGLPVGRTAVEVR